MSHPVGVIQNGGVLSMADIREIVVITADQTRNVVELEGYNGRELVSLPSGRWFTRTAALDERDRPVFRELPDPK